MPGAARRAPRRSGSILSGASVLVFGRYASAVLAWVGTVFVVRYLTRTEWGQFSFILGLLGIVGLVADLKLSRIVLQQVLAAGDRAGDVVGSYVGLRLVIGLASYAAALVWVIAFDYPHVVIVGTAVGGLNLVILSGAWGTALLFEAKLWLRDLAAASLVGYVVQFALTVGIALVGVASVLWFQWATVANAIVFLAALLWTTHHVARVRVSFRPSEWGEWLKEAAPLALGAALDTVYFRIDIVMLSLLDSYRAVGTYSVGYKFSDLVGAVPLGIVTPAMTLMVAAWPGAIARFRATFRHTLVILTVAAIGAGVGFTVFAGPLVTALYGGQYSGAAGAARLLMAGQVLHFFTLLCFVTLVSAGRNRLYPVAMLVGVVVNVTLNLVLIPAYSYTGSGWATVITESLVLLVLGAGVARIPGVRPYPWLALGKCVVAGAVMAGTGWALLGRIPWPLAGFVSGLVYLGVLHVTRVDGPGGLRALAGEPADDGRAPTESPLGQPS